MLIQLLCNNSNNNIQLNEKRPTFCIEQSLFKSNKKTATTTTNLIEDNEQETISHKIQKTLKSFFFSFLDFDISDNNNIVYLRKIDS